jgi:hypothetical protein
MRLMKARIRKERLERGDRDLATMRLFGVSFPAVCLGSLALLHAGYEGNQ